MSASRDTKQAASASFISSNFYEHYKNLAHAKGIILKSEVPSIGQVKIVTPEHQRDLNEWAEHSKEIGKRGISQSLLELRESRKRLMYLVSELNEIVKA